MTPYYDKGKKYARVTEITGAGDCEATGAIEEDERLRKAPRTSHMVTLPGTLTHSKIQQMEERTMGKTSKGLYLQSTDQKLFSKIFAQHKKMKKKDQKTHTTYENLMDKVNDCFANYLAFSADYPHKPIKIEHKMLSTKYRCGGTVDMVALIWVKGHTIHHTPDENTFSDKIYFKICDHGPNCKRCSKSEVVCVVDWKTSTRKQKGHIDQMAAYFCMLEAEGMFDEWRRKGKHICWQTWSVLLGTHNLKRTKTPYQLHLYEPYIASFLVKREVNERPEFITRNLAGKTGLKGRCMFCSYIMSCPDRLLWNLGGEIEFQTAFTRQELASLSLVMNNLSSPRFTDLGVKIDNYLEYARGSEEEIALNIPEVLMEFERRLDIQVAKSTV